MLPLLVGAAATFAALWYILDYIYAPKWSPNEPPLVSHPIPYVGHILELIRYGTAYYRITRYDAPLPGCITGRS